MEVINDASNSAFQNMQKILEFEDNNSGFDFSPNNFFYSNLKYLEQYAESNVAVDDQIIKTLRLYKKSFEQNVDVFEESILNSNLVNTLIIIILKIKDKLTNQGKRIAYCSNMLHLAIIQQQVFDIFISLSKCSNLVILMILDDNKLFNNIASLSPTIHYSGQAISFLTLFHSYFEKFPNISYSYYIPNNFVNDILQLANKNQYFNSRTAFNSILILFEDLLKYVELTIDDVDYMITATLAMLYDFEKYDLCANACSLMKLFFKKCDDSVYAFTEDLSIPTYFFGVMKSFPEDKNYTILCDFCSVINECFDYISDEQLKLDIIQIFEPEVIFSILKRTYSKKINVTPIISLISRHFEIQKMPLDYFISSGGYDIVIEYLNDSTGLCLSFEAIVPNVVYFWLDFNAKKFY